VDQVVDETVVEAVDETVDKAVDDAGPIAVTPEHLQVGEEQDTIGTEMQSMDDIRASSSPEHNLDPSVSCGDFHKVVKYKNSKQRELSDYKKHFLFNHHFIPNATYKFPANTCGKQQRHSQHTWLAKYKVLAYSKSVDGAIVSIVYSLLKLRFQDDHWVYLLINH